MAPSPPAAPAELTLRDGSRLTVRPIEPDDKALLADGFAALSPESRYKRFFTTVDVLDDHQLAFLTEVDHHEHEALLALDPETGAAAGVARYVRVRPDAAEVAVTVADRWQGRGLGTALLERLADRAVAEGVARFSGTTLADNRHALRLIAALGETTYERVGTELRFEVELTRRPEAWAALRELVRAAAAGLLAPARRLAPRHG